MRPHSRFCHHLKLYSVVIVLFSMIGSSPAAAPVYPLKQSANGRYLVDQLNAPFLLTGDSPQSLIVNLSSNDAAMYFADRAALGFNTVWINLLCNDYTYGRPDGSTYDGILPFTNNLPSSSSYDLTTPNEAYFARADSMIRLAAQYGLLVLFDPIETGGWLERHSIMSDNGTNSCRAYGQFLGNRYKDYPNILWMSGNDFQDWNNAQSDPLVLSVARGIQDTDNNHIQTVELSYPVSSSLDDPNWAPIIRLNATYTYYPTYAQLLVDYNRTNFLPNFMVEANYEYEDNFGNLGALTPQILRRQEYWTMLSGACGQMYGNHYTWQFINGWQSNLDTPGTSQFGIMTSLFASRPWYTLIPDANHKIFTGGLGTFSDTGPVTDNDYVTAAATADGSSVIAYLPTTRTVTADLSKLPGPVMAQWFDPADGESVSILGSPFVNAGTHQFAPPGTNSDGQGDWVLILDRFNPMPGAYDGLFSETDQVRQSSSGFIIISMNSRGRYSGHVQIGQLRHGFSGSIGSQGQITNMFFLKKGDPLTFSAQFGSGPQSGQILGQISNSTWAASVVMNRAVYNSKTNPPPYTNRFTLYIAGQRGNPALPAGCGFGTAQVDRNGNGLLSAALADGTKVSQSAPLGKDGVWPLYAALSGNGSLCAWLQISNLSSSDINGTLIWIKPANSRSRYYPGGFTNSTQLIGSVYVPPHDGTIFNASNGFLEFSGGNLASAFTNAVALGPKYRVTNLSPDVQLSLNFSTSRGTFGGNVTPPGTPKSLSFRGALLEKLTAGYGFLLGTDQSSQVTFTPSK